ncbi:MAG: hypothetical protein JWO35_565 [Candidatus Saccharibacteria bacterium]|nr:hypothetical protein [Candidatus Saccharibacteria bacterium]
MTAINHALTGAVIGLVVGQPLLALPMAVVSHYVCDALPHFGLRMSNKLKLKTNGFRNYLIVEAALCFLLVVMLAVLHPANWLLAAECAFLAAAPDFLSINRYLTTRAGKHWKPGLYSKFAGGIQWFERPIGAVVEVAWLIAAIIVMAPFLVR